MKTATKIYDRIEQRCETVPFKVIDLGGQVLIKHFWSKRQGATGYQVHTVVHDLRPPEIVMGYNQTAGAGYCKESQAYWTALAGVGLMAREDRGAVKGGAGISHKYHVGGNYYFVPKSEILKYK